MAIFNTVFYGGSGSIPNYLCFTASAANSTIQLTKNETPASVSLEKSTDGKNWSDYTIWDTIALPLIWDKVYLRNKSETDTQFSTGANNNYYYFVMTGSIAGSWDIGYLLNKNSTNTYSNRCFCNLFDNCTSLITAPELLATTVWVYSCLYMFKDCINLIACPSLSATTLNNYCYSNMFSGCTKITSAPALPATILAAWCYSSMFMNCTDLKYASSLPATTLASDCYNSMFQSCTNLETIPALIATNYPSTCCSNMFSNCRKIKMSTSATYPYNYQYRIPKSWTWTAGNYSFNSMFSNTWGTFNSTPSINTTYYTANVIV